MPGSRKYRFDRTLATLLGVIGGIWLLLTLVSGFSSGGGNGAARCYTALARYACCC